MGTAEILIVFSALMALIALVTIGIDWIGKPLKNRRFIPRIYRFEDEKLPVDAYGNTDFSAHRVAPQQPARVAPPAQQAQPAQPIPPARPVRGDQRAPRTVARVPARTATAFSDSLAPAAAASASADPMAGARSTIAGTETPVRTTRPWKPGMALDASVEDRKPNLATKAERYWMTTAETVGQSHFDDDDIARMIAGKAPRRVNPRTGKAETMQLTGLRRASAHADVRMRWPDDAVDPWNAT